MKKFKIGIIGTENSHAKQFCEIFNKPDENGKTAYPDCHVTFVYGDYPEESQKLVEQNIADAVANSIEEMVDSVDAVMITARDGKFHAKFSKPFIEAGIPAFIDKPFTTDAEEALDLVRLAKAKNLPLCGGSSLKYADTIQELKAVKESIGEKLRGGAMAAPLNFNNPYSGFWFYSSHLAEMCMEVFGWQPKSVTATENNQNVYAIVNYDNFSVNCSFLEHSYSSYSGAVFGGSGSISEVKKVDVSNIFRLECEAFVDMLRTGKMTHSYEELIAPVFFIEAVKRAYETGKTIDILYQGI